MGVRIDSAGHVLGGMLLSPGLYPSPGLPLFFGSILLQRVPPAMCLPNNMKKHFLVLPLQGKWHCSELSKMSKEKIIF